SAVIWPQTTTALRHCVRNPYDPTSAKTTILKKCVTITCRRLSSLRSRRPPNVNSRRCDAAKIISTTWISPLSSARTRGGPRRESSWRRLYLQMRTVRQFEPQRELASDLKPECFRGPLQQPRFQTCRASPRKRYF